MPGVKFEMRQQVLHRQPLCLSPFRAVVDLAGIQPQGPGSGQFTCNQPQARFGLKGPVYIDSRRHVRPARRQRKFFDPDIGASAHAVVAESVHTEPGFTVYQAARGAVQHAIGVINRKGPVQGPRFAGYCDVGCGQRAMPAAVAPATCQIQVNNDLAPVHRHRELMVICGALEDRGQPSEIGAGRHHGICLQAPTRRTLAVGIQLKRTRYAVCAPAVKQQLVSREGKVKLRLRTSTRQVTGRVEPALQPRRQLS